MKENKFLYQQLENELGKRNIKNTPLPPIITENLNSKFSLREYQKEAFQYFINYWQEKFEDKPDKHKIFFYTVTLWTGFNLSSDLFTELAKKGVEKKEKDFCFKQFSTTVVKKAVHKLSFYNFFNLKQYFPNLNTLEEFISQKEYLGDIKIVVSRFSNQLEQPLTPDEELTVVIKVLEQISTNLATKNSEWRGSKEFKQYFLREKISDKVLNFATDNENKERELDKSMKDVSETNIYLDISSKPWYVFDDCFGTSEEKHFVKYIDKIYGKLQEKYAEIYLVRNERFFKLYTFEDGSSLEPDYVLFLQQKNSPRSFHYQIFVEPKGNHLKERDAWKQKFLVSLKKEHKIEQLWEDKEYIILGMPFYNKNEENNFDDEFKKELL